MKVSVVVDLAFGDSGKGVTVDSLCMDTGNPIVIRFSSGQQCGHTVYLDEKTSHIHSNFGSGTLRGVPSYFTRDCCMYLNTLAVEYAELEEKTGRKPVVTYHPLSIITTPYDVAFNRICDTTMKH